MRQLARVILVAAVAASVLVPAVGVLRGRPLDQMVLAGLALAFATTPEELPILVTILLAVGGRRLARQRVLLRRLRAGETVGEVTFVVTDNRLEVDRIEGGDAGRVLATALATLTAEERDSPDHAGPEPAAIARAAADAGVQALWPAVGFRSTPTASVPARWP